MDGAGTMSTILLWVAVLANLLMTIGMLKRFAGRGDDAFSLLGVGERAPRFRLGTLQGYEVDSSELLRQTVVLVFVSPQCGSCQRLLLNIAHTRAAVEQFGARLVLASGAGIAETRAMVGQCCSDIPILVAPQADTALFTDYGVRATPSFCVVDTRGVVRAVGINVDRLPKVLRSLTPLQLPDVLEQSIPSSEQ